eukprot:6490978-Amphidinium_carterae.2
MAKLSEDESVIQVYLHTSATNMKKCLIANELGRRYLFSSCIQCLAHCATHHHFELSGATLKSGEVYIVQAQVSEDWLCDNATRCDDASMATQSASG